MEYKSEQVKKEIPILPLYPLSSQIPPFQALKLANDLVAYSASKKLYKWYSSRLDDNRCGICMSTDTSTYQHWDAGYGRPS